MSTLKLRVQKYRRFTDPQEICFHHGLTIISGSNGSGKSTLVEAILYALFGSRRGSSIADIRSDKAKGDPYVECELLIDDQAVNIIRAGNAVEVSINDVIQIMRSPSNAKAANQRIASLLGGLTREQFESSYIALQGDTAGLVEYKARERHAIIEKILQLEVLTQAASLQGQRCEGAEKSIVALGDVICDELSLNKEARTLMENFQNARRMHKRVPYVQDFLKHVEQAISGQQKEVQVAETQVVEMQTYLSTLRQQQSDHQVTMERALQVYQQQEKQQKGYNELKEGLSNIEGKLEQVKQDIRKCKDDIGKAEKYAEASAEYERQQTEKEHGEKRLAHLPLLKKCYNAFVQTQTQLEELDRQFVDLATVDEELHLAKEQEALARQSRDVLHSNNPVIADNEEWQKHSSKVDHEEEQNRKALELLTKGTSDARCPTCDQLFTEHTSERRIQHLTTWLTEAYPSMRKQLEQQKQSIDKRKEQWEQAKQQAEEKWYQLQKDTGTVEKRIVTRDMLHQQRNSLDLDFLKKQQAWIELEEHEPDPQEEIELCHKLTKLTEHLKGLKTQADAYAHLPFFLQSLTDKEQRQNALYLEKQALLEQQRALGYHLEDFQTAKDLVEKLRNKDTEIRSQLHEVELKLQSTDTTLQQAQTKAEKMREYHDRFETHVQEYYREEHLREHLEDFKKYFFEANTGEVMKRTTQLLMHAVTDQSILGVKFDKDEFQYLDASNIAHPISRLSGGEKSLVGLCLRIALAEQAQAITRTGRVKFLILDEVLSSLDDERCDAVQRIFVDVQKRGIFEHIIMITHLDSVKQGWRASGLVVQKVEGKMSTVVSVSPGKVPMDLAEEIEV